MESLTRREALKKLYQAITLAGAASFISFEDLSAAANQGGDDKPNVLWLHGSSCSGCSCSFLNIDDVPVVDVITQFMNLIFHPDLSLATGDQVEHLLLRLKKSGKPFILVVEGGIPVGSPHACMFAGKPIAEWIKLLLPSASAVVAAGTCAAFGGVTKMHGMKTGTISLTEYLKKLDSSAPLIALPSCPMKPEHLVYSLLHVIQLNKVPKLDQLHRPLKYFTRSIHERCQYYSDFQEERFAERPGETGCYFKIGCQGPVTYSNCQIMGYNGNTANCIKTEHPCVGCASEYFPRKIMMHRFNDERNLEKL